jgi:4-hydroxy-3-methylbut-2-enyl diphosphate reductase IspH
LSRATQRGRSAQELFFAAQLTTLAGESAAATQLLQLQVRSHATMLPEDICARTQLRHTAAHPA